MHDLVSVIIPTYNRENCILDSINSVLNQTYKNIEIIIIDDGSNDNTVDLINQLNDNRIKVIINKKNMGACFSRNKGVSVANGKYIAFQDSDDIWELDKLEICMSYIIQNNFDMVFSSYLLNDSRIVPNYNLNKKKNKLMALLKKNCISTQTIVAKKEVFINEPFDTTMPRYQDYEVSIRILQKYNVYFIDKPLVKVYIQENSITKQTNKGVIALKIILDKYYYLLKQDKDVLASFYSNLGVHIQKAGENGKEYFKKSLKCKFNLMVLIRYILSSFMLYEFIDNIIWRHR